MIKLIIKIVSEETETDEEKIAERREDQFRFAKMIIVLMTKKDDDIV